ncbi:MAG TPA: CHAT domain-containing protein [Candidatus Polarisedimenticolaceae bacterium]
MKRLARRTLLGVAILAAAPAPVRAVTIESCEAGLRGTGHAVDRWACFFMAAREQKAWPEVRRRLEAAVAVDPANDAARIVLAGVLADLRDPGADASYRRAIDGFVAGGDAYAEARARVWYAMYLGYGGRNAEAEEQLGAASSAAARSEDAVVGARVEAQRGWQAIRLADYAAARAAFERAGTVAFREGPDDLASAVAGGLGAVAWATGRYREGLEAYLADAERCRIRGDRFEESTQRSNAAVLAGRLLERGEISVEEVTGLVQAAVDSAVAAGNPAAEAAACLLLARLRSVPDERQGELARRALDVGRNLGNARLEVQALRALAVRSRQPDEALALVDEAIDAAKTRGSPDEVVRSLFARSHVQWRFARRAEAIAACEAAFDAVDALHAGQSDTLIAARVAAEWGSWYATCAGRTLGDGEPSDEDLAVAFEMAERGRRGSATLASLRRTLADDEAMLVFQLSTRLEHPEIHLFDDRGGSWVFVIERERVRVVPVGESVELEPRIELYLGLVDASDPGASRAGRRLHAELFEAPLRTVAPTVRRLVVVPDRGMHRLPVAALPTGEGDARLASRYEISIAPSASAWLAARGGASVPPSALAVADPETKDSAQVAVFRSAYGRIPRAVDEATWLVRLLGGESRVVTAEAASERFIKTTDLAPYGVVHFAAHAVVDDARPDRAAIVLARGDPSEDGLLTAAEIAALDLRGRVVVLSACSSAGGELLSGEGVFGLTRAFFRAGARAVVASLWPVRDDDAAAFVSDLAAELARGRRLSDGFARVRRDRIEAGVADVAWAGFELYGDGAVVVAPGGSGTVWSRIAPLRAVHPGGLVVGIVAAGLVVVVGRRVVPLLAKPPREKGEHASREPRR